MTTDKNAKPAEEEVDIFANAEQVEIDESDRLSGTSTIGTKFIGICQNQGTNVQKLEAAGKFFTKNDEGELEFYETLEVIMLESQRRGTRFEDKSVVCRSYGGIVGQNNEKCASCEYSPFVKNDIPQTAKCKGSYVVLCVPADNWHAEPFFFQVGAGAIKDFKDYASDLQNKHKRPVFSVVTRITTVRRDNGHGSLNFVPVFKPIKALGAEDTANLRNLRIAEAKRFNPIDESTPTGAAMAAEEAAASGDRDPFVDE